MGTCGGTKRGKVYMHRLVLLCKTIWGEPYRTVKDGLATTTILQDIGSADLRTGNQLTAGLARAGERAATGLAVAVIVVEATTRTGAATNGRERAWLLL
jgi:hypothetical protein